MLGSYQHNGTSHEDFTQSNVFQSYLDDHQTFIEGNSGKLPLVNKNQKEPSQKGLETMQENEA